MVYSDVIIGLSLFGSFARSCCLRQLFTAKSLHAVRIVTNIFV